MTPKRVVFLVFAALFAAFIIQNSGVVQLRFLFWKAQASRSLVLLGTFVAGVVIGWLAARFYRKQKGTATPLEH